MRKPLRLFMAAAVTMVMVLAMIWLANRFSFTRNLVQQALS